MKEPKIIAIGDNVCDKYLSRGKMYPGGQCVNTCVYAKWNGVNSAYLGKYGNDEVAECVQRLIRVNGGIPEALFRFRGIRILFCFLFLLNPILRKACGQISPFLFLLFPADCKSDNQRNYSQNEHNQRQKGKEDLLRGIINRCIIENLCKFCAVDNLSLIHI